MKKGGGEKTWDIVVIGGGASGMMAAATAAKNGAAVCVLEKNARLGKKLSISGGGRCNVTNNRPQVREMLEAYRDRGKFLFSTFTQHGVKESVSWFTSRGVTLKEENEGRLFPNTDSAETICETLETELNEYKVTVRLHAEVTGIEKTTEGFVITTKDKEVFAKKCILATGGLSRPDTGSTGDGFSWAMKLGHTINSHNLSLVPITVKESWVRDVSGVSLDDVKLKVAVDDTREFTERGRILFTHTGLSGPTILNMSKRLSDLYQAGTVTINLQLLPEQDEGSIKTTLTELFHANSNKTVRNALATLLPTAIINVLLSLASIDPTTPCHSVRVTEKKQLMQLMFNLPVSLTGFLGPEKAVISAGGVAVEEVDFKSMQSLKVPGLYFTGDLLDIDRPSGGYSLQLCWSTGFVAGTHASTS